MNDIIFTQVPVKDLIEQIRVVVRAEIKAEHQREAKDTLVSPAQACEMFTPKISLVTLSKWTKDGLIPSQKIGGRVWYKQSDLLSAGTKLRRYHAK